MNMLVSIEYSSFLVVAAVGMFVVDFFDHDVQQEKARISRFHCLKNPPHFARLTGRSFPMLALLRVSNRWAGGE